MIKIKNIIKNNRIIPVIVINDVKSALKIADIFIANNIKIIEITLRTPNALEIISKISNTFPEIVVGVGTVTSYEMVNRARDNGASFAVSPGFTKKLIKGCQKISFPLLPGAATVSEIMNLKQEGFKYIKFFPASSSGGIEFIKSIYSPFPELVFCPTGGINAENAKEWLSLPNVYCLGGSWIASKALIEDKEWSIISENALQASKL